MPQTALTPERLAAEGHDIGGSAYRVGVETATPTWRALTTEDGPALARACAAVEAVDHTGELYSEQDVRDVLEDESIDLARDTLAALAPDGEFVAFAWLHGPVEVTDLDRVDAHGAVVPAARGSGLGRRLLEWAEERTASLHRERHPDIPGAVCVVVHENNPSKRALVRAAGFAATRWWHKLTRNLDESLPDVAPDPARAHADTVPAGSGRGGPAGAPGGVRRPLGRHAAGRPQLIAVVYGGPELPAGRQLAGAGWCGGRRVPADALLQGDAAATGVREAFVEQVGVRPGWRRHGLGRLLLAAALESYRAAGYQRSALTVDTGNATSALGLYRRAEFAVKDASVTWMKSLR